MKTIEIPATLKITEIKIDLSQEHFERVSGIVEIHPLMEKMKNPQTTMIDMALPPEIILQLENLIQNGMEDIITGKNANLRIR